MWVYRNLGGLSIADTNPLFFSKNCGPLGGLSNTPPSVTHGELG